MCEIEAQNVLEAEQYFVTSVLVMNPEVYFLICEIYDDCLVLDETVGVFLAEYLVNALVFHT